MKLFKLGNVPLTENNIRENLQLAYTHTVHEMRF